MIVFSRKKNESIVINGVIEIVVVEIRGDKVRLGVNAPMEKSVHRGEVYDAILRHRPLEDLASNPARMRRRVRALQDEIQWLEENQQTTLRRIEELKHELLELELHLTEQLPAAPR
jgi:carbon storage regulator